MTPAKNLVGCAARSLLPPPPSNDVLDFEPERLRGGLFATAAFVRHRQLSDTAGAGARATAPAAVLAVFSGIGMSASPPRPLLAVGAAVARRSTFAPSRNACGLPGSVRPPPPVAGAPEVVARALLNELLGDALEVAVVVARALLRGLLKEGDAFEKEADRPSPRRVRRAWASSCVERREPAPPPC